MTTIPLWRAQRERGSRLLMQVIVALTLWVGRPIGRALLYPICAYFLLFSRAARAASRAYLGRVLGRPPTWRERFRHYHCFARQLLDRIHLLTGDLARFGCVVEGQDVLERALERKCGVLAVGAHLGSFEMMRVVALARSPIRVRVLMYAAHAEKLAAVLGPLNADVQQQVIALGRPETMLEVREALAAGEVVGLLADRVVAGDRVRPSTFLGANALFAEGPFVLAAALGAPIVLFSAVQGDDERYRIRFEPFAERIEFTRRTRDVVLQQACDRYAAWLDARCREAPFNWFNFYDFWTADAAAGRR
ncbi:MAG: lipid A biosynthesis acyltransferase [Betaproteobacteria bacterium]